MLARIGGALSEFWLRLNPREQRLAQAVGGLSALFVVYVIVTGLLAQLDALDTEIEAKQSRIVSLTEQINIKSLVEREYARVASQHSSEWSEAEIRDRLREEVLRLALVSPPALEDNVPVTLENQSGALVSVPTLEQGALRETDEGYREYSLSVRIPDATMPNLVDYLLRLEQSPQSLRVDGLTVARPPNSERVRATIDLTRIVVDAAPELEVATPAEAEAIDPEELIARAPEDWVARGGAISQALLFNTVSDSTLELVPRGDNAEFYFPRVLPAGYSYDLVLDVTAQGRASLGIYDPTAGAAYAGERVLEGDGNTYRYRLRFTPPGELGARPEVGLPYVRLVNNNTKVYLDGIRIERVES